MFTSCSTIYQGLVVIHNVEWWGRRCIEVNYRFDSDISIVKVDMWRASATTSLTVMAKTWHIAFSFLHVKHKVYSLKVELLYFLRTIIPTTTVRKSISSKSIDITETIVLKARHLISIAVRIQKYLEDNITVLGPLRGYF